MACCSACDQGKPCCGGAHDEPYAPSAAPAVEYGVRGCASGACGIRFVETNRSGLAVNPSAPVEEVPDSPFTFRPGVGPTIATQAQRTPIFAATSMSPGAKMYETQWASSVPIERPGPAFLVPGSKVINPSALMGMVPVVRTNVQIPQYPLGRLTGNPFIRSAGDHFVSRARGPVPADFSPGDRDAQRRWDALGEEEQRRWLEDSQGSEAGVGIATGEDRLPIPAGFEPGAPGREAAWNRKSPTEQRAWVEQSTPATAPQWFVQGGGTQTDWVALGPAGRAARQAEHDEATRMADVARIVDVATRFTGDALTQALGAYTSYNRNENALRLNLAREETQRQKNAADAASLNNPQAREQAARLQTALDNISRVQQENTRFAQGQLGQQQQLSQGLMIAIGIGAVLAVGTIVFVATRPRSNPSRRRRSR